MKPTLKSGGTFATILVILILVAALAGGGAYLLNRFHLLPTSNNNQVQKTSQTFMGMPIMHSTNFKDAGGQDKRFIIVKAREDGGIPIADTYITDKQLSSANAVKIPELSNDNSLAYSATTFPVGGTRLVISPSSGIGKKFIVVTQTIGNATTLTIVDENGKIISSEVANKIFTIAQSKCQCKITFDSWSKDAKFQVRVATEAGENYIVQVDAKNGLLVDGLKKV